MRQFVESLVLLALAVTLFRAFAAEGYMISTGSMAPCLLGYHQQITCPGCGCRFARGTRVQVEALAERGVGLQVAYAQSLVGDPPQPQDAMCPNCGLGALVPRDAPINEGDQLMVHKHAYLFRRPRPWEVIVFRNPDDPTQAYVKRVVGLPGESIELRDGDVYANGRLRRKTLATQRGLRIPVDIHNDSPTDDDPDSQHRWLMDEGSGWRAEGTRFLYAPQEDARPADELFAEASVDIVGRRATVADGYEWVGYRHWIRRGGRQRTSMFLEAWPEGLPLPNPVLSPLEYDEAGRQLRCIGALPTSLKEELLVAATRLGQPSAGPFVQAVRQLYERSHVSPIVDTYGYNHPDAAQQENPVHDLMLELTFTTAGSGGGFAVSLTDGLEEFTCELDFERGAARLLANGDPDAMRNVALPAGCGSEATVLEMSLMDRQVLVALDGELLFDPVGYAATGEARAPLRRAAQFGAQGVSLVVEELALYRDVHYTPSATGRGAARYDLGPDEYFVLGDNSPVSIDSRSWKSPGVSSDLLIGKPLLVHLPSRQGTFTWRGQLRSIRIPDLSRIRYIR